LIDSELIIDYDGENGIKKNKVSVLNNDKIKISNSYFEK